MKLTLVIIVCVALYTVSATTSEESVDEIDETYEKILEIVEEYAESQRQLHDLYRDFWYQLKNADKKFKSKCIVEFEKKIGPIEKWDNKKMDNYRTAFVILTEPIKIVIDRKYHQFLNMAKNHAKNPGEDKKYNLRTESWDNLKSANEHFKSSCLQIFEEKYGSNEENWSIKDEVMCRTAYVILNKQLGDFINIIKSSRINKLESKKLDDGSRKCDFLEFLGKWFQTKKAEPKWTETRIAVETLKHFNCKAIDD